MCETIHLRSIGNLACLVQRPVEEVERVLTEVGAKPAFVINDIPHYFGEVAGTLFARVNGWTDQRVYHRRFDVEPQEVRT